MRHNSKNNDRSNNRFFKHLAEDKKKVVLALCLIVFMVFMWIKLLTRTSPKSAEAELLDELIEQQNQSEQELEISFIKLPQVKGRNDLIVRDYFTSNNWQSFLDGKGRKSVGVKEIDIDLKDDDQEVIKKVAENLKLEAIVSSENPLAFINDKVLKAGDKLFVGDGIEKYECEVVEIKENIVVVKCRESRITLKLTLVN